MAIGGLFKPEYLLKPRNALARLRYRDTRKLPAMMTIGYCGRPFRIHPHEVIGRQLLHFGLFDLLVTETLLRLADPGELAVDLGANIGAMSRVLAQAVGSQGRVVAFEPFAAIYQDLVWNCAGYPVETQSVAVSDHCGEGHLSIPQAFSSNRGIATLETSDPQAGSIRVATVTLDRAFAVDKIGVMKIDIEGHELAALRGASQLLGERRVRDIVFEEHQPRNSAVARHLVESGYHIFRLHKTFGGPRLISAEAAVVDSQWESPALLATLDPDRATRRLAPLGWRALREL